MNISIQIDGRRHYIIGNTFPLKDKFHAANVRRKVWHWDGERRAWWTSKLEIAEAIIAVAAAPSAPTDEGCSTTEPIVRGRALYEGKTYYLLTDGVSNASGKPYCKLAFRDGSRVFWAKNPAAVQVVKRYREPRSIAAIKRFAEKATTFGTDECRCICHSEPNAGQPGSTLYDGCDRCGCEEC